MCIQEAWAQQESTLPVSAVFHAAGVLTDAMVGQQSHARLRRCAKLEYMSFANRWNFMHTMDRCSLRHQLPYSQQRSRYSCSLLIPACIKWQMVDKTWIHPTSPLNCIPNTRLNCVPNTRLNRIPNTPCPTCLPHATLNTPKKPHHELICTAVLLPPSSVPCQPWMLPWNVAPWLRTYCFPL